MVDGIVIWVSEFEKRATLESMHGLKYLIESIRIKGVHKVYSLYGGYVTAQFYHYGMNGLSYGLTYGDSKPVNQQAAGGGGAPLGTTSQHSINFSHRRRYLLSIHSIQRHFNANAQFALIPQE